MIGEANLNQQGSFWSQTIQKKAGPLLETMHFAFDKEFFSRLIVLGYRFECSSEIIGARYRQHKECKWKRGLLPFKYDWAKVSLRYLPKDIPNYNKIRRNIYKGMAYCRIRFSQNITKSNRSRVIDLLSAVYYSPSVVFRRDFFGSLLRVIVPKYESLRNRQLGK